MSTLTALLQGAERWRQEEPQEVWDHLDQSTQHQIRDPALNKAGGEDRPNFILSFPSLHMAYVPLTHVNTHTIRIHTVLKSYTNGFSINSAGSLVASLSTNLFYKVRRVPRLEDELWVRHYCVSQVRGDMPCMSVGWRERALCTVVPRSPSVGGGGMGL